MVFIGFVLLGVGLVIGVLLALSDPVLLSRINGEDAEGQSGRHIPVVKPQEREEERPAASVTVAV
ncbi:hypothetical protein [Nonomuraea sp. SBT364]|uniref:hypothetical protein n=1 Tax=Nonomuraea sp. SBT364 TaxID=1580530 RepID=UPI00066A7684|nr:hypothetical protein [Nonomuraea sp. SBT364]